MTSAFSRIESHVIHLASNPYDMKCAFKSGKLSWISTYRREDINKPLSRVTTTTGEFHASMGHNGLEYDNLQQSAVLSAVGVGVVNINISRVLVTSN